MSKTIKALSPIDHDGTRYNAGDTFECSDDAAAALVAVKSGEYADQAEGAGDDPAPPARKRKQK